ncbi:MAG: hypothetical protein IPH41_02350 [Sulfuritalea sp.]|jgi:hypothetical protein|nr:hypothetical protein [Sulfuritalea sp.]
MSGTHTINFANFICRFGNEKVLLDLAEEVIFPAFLSTRERRYGDSRLFFTETALVNLGTSANPELLLVGRMIHDTILTREQVMQNGKLIRDRAKMPSAPSALFALVLDTHKLLYLPETRQAPSLTTFRATAARFIKDAHLEFARRRATEIKAGGVKTNRAKVLKEYPLPTVEVVPLSSDTSLKQFLDQFKTLHQVRIDLIKPNDEIDSAGLLKKMREAGNALGATDSALIYRTSGAEKSLSHAKALKGLKPIVSEGNAKVTLSGKDRHGDTLTGNNESFKMGIPIADVSTNPREAARDLYDAFREKVNDGLLKVQAVGQNVHEKIKKLANQAAK